MSIPKTFFIADDDADDRELFISALHDIDASCNCITAFDGQDAVTKLAAISSLPDFIFLDLNMPKLNGKECLAEIKKDSRFKNVPVIIYSTASVKKEIDEAISKGAAFFLQKPNRYDDLSKALTNILAYNWG